MKRLLREFLRSLSSKDKSISEEQKQKLPPKIKRRRDKTTIQVGIDFGTSSTKIAYFQHGSIGNKVQPVLFNHSLENYPEYCLPSLAVFDDANDFLLGKEAAKFLSTKSWDQGLRYFKMIVAGKYNVSFYDETVTQNFNQSLRNNKYNAEHVTAAFLAYSIRNSKKLIGKLYPGYLLDFVFNICIPIDQVEDSKVKPVFDKILACSQGIETKWADETNHKDLLDLAKTNIESAEYDEENPETRVFSVPEAVAEVASYLKSLKSQDGIHAVIDIGAGSTDVSIFYLHNIRQTGEHSFWYAARNLPRGGRRVEKIIFDCITTEIGREPPDVLVLDQLNNFRQASQDLKVKVKKELMELWKESLPVWRLAYANEANELSWQQEKVTVFLCGGGSNFPFAKDIFKNSWMLDWGPYPVSDLPCKEDYNSTDAPFKRMSVAFGLAQPTPTFSKYTLPNDCPDRTPAPLPLRPLPNFPAENP